METQAGATKQSKSRRFLGLSKDDVGWLLFSYVFSFVCFRFNISRHYGFEPPMATGKAALVAIPVASVMAVLIKIRSRRKPASEESHFTSLSLGDVDSSPKHLPVNDDDKYSQ